jgi:hypothetical protein
MYNREMEEQGYLMNWAKFHEAQYPELKWLYHIPNGAGKLSYRQAAMLKKGGVKRGVLDLFLPTMRGGFGGMYIEMKYGSNTLTPEQRIFKQDMFSAGYFCVVCYSWQEAVEHIEKYLKEGYVRKEEGFITR